MQFFLYREELEGGVENVVENGRSSHSENRDQRPLLERGDSVR